MSIYDLTVKAQDGRWIRITAEAVLDDNIKADERLPFEELFFDSTFDTPLTKDKAGKFESL